MDNLKGNFGGQAMGFYIGINGQVYILPSSPLSLGVTFLADMNPNGNGSFPTYEFAIMKNLQDPFMMSMFQFSVGTEDTDASSQYCYVAVGAEYTGNKQDWSGNPWDNPLYYPIFTLNTTEGPPMSSVPNNPPEIQNVLTQSDTVIPEDIPYSLDIDATDSDGHTVSYSLPIRPYSMSINTSSGLITWTPDDGDVGVNHVMVIADDRYGGYDTLDFNITVVNVNDTPSIVSTPNTNATENQLYTYAIYALDGDAGDVLTYTLLIGPSGMSLTDTLITWTPTKDQSGDTIVSIEVKDSYNVADTQTYTLHVNIVNDPPVFVSSPDTVVYEDSLYVYAISTTDDENDSIAYTLLAYPSGMALSRDTVYWRPNNSHVGSNNVILRASDGHGGNTNQIFSIRVINTPDIPVFDNLIPSGDTTISEGDSLLFYVSASDPDSSNDSLTLYWFVNGDHVNAQNAYMMYADFSSAGLCSVRVLVFDGQSQSEHIWQVTIENTALPPEVVSPGASGVATSDSLVSWNVPLDPDPDTNSLLYRLEFSRSSAFDTLLKSVDSLDRNSYLLYELVDEGELPTLTVIFMRVVAYDGNGYSTGYSDSTTSFLFLRYVGLEEDTVAVPEDYMIDQNRPNPFNPSTFIRFGVPERVEKMVFRIFDIKGRLVRTIGTYSLKPGYYTVTWDGRDSRGGLCQNGVYICKVQCDKFRKSIKMTMIK
jgi:hypothetical protein